MTKIGSLFSGIGGLELGLGESMGAHPIWQIENDKHARTILDRHWPLVPTYGDITEVDFAELEPPDVLCGGFPCQDISAAGLKAGIEGAKSGLWTEFERAIRVLRPRVVVVENVAALLVRGFDVVAADLASLGYDMRWECLRSADVWAAHRRERIFVFAYPKSIGFDGARIAWCRRSGSFYSGESASHSDGPRSQGSVATRERLSTQRGQAIADPDGQPVGEHPGAASAGESRIRSGSLDHGSECADANRSDTAITGTVGELETRSTAGLSDASRCGRWDYGRYTEAIDRWAAIHGPPPAPKDERGRLSPRFSEWMMGFPPGWVEGIPYTAQLRCIGNAVQPQVAALIGL